MNAKTVLPIVCSAVSLATLWYFRAFRRLLYPSDFRYFDLEVPYWYEYAAILTCVVVQASLLTGIGLAAEISKNAPIKRILNILFLGLGIASFGSLSSEMLTWLKPEAVRFVNLPLPLFILILCVCLSYIDGFGLGSIVSRLRSFAMLGLPFAMLLLIQTGVIWATGGETSLGGGEIERGVSTNKKSEVQNRVVWIIFDELGLATMRERPDSVKMPEMDRLKSESVVAENAYPPDEFTHVSIPALFTGQPLKETKVASANDLSLFRLESDTAISFRETPNIIDDVREFGGQVAIAGWYHPYTRLFGDKLAYGYFQQWYPKDCFGYTECVRITYFTSLENIPGVFRILALLGIDVNVEREKYATEMQAARNEYLRERARAIASDPNIDLVYLHFPIPHWPYVNKNDQPARRGYYGALEAVDRTLSEIRQSLTAAGQWDKTTLIVTADHWRRKKSEKDFSHIPAASRAQLVENTRIPFIVKLPGQKARVSYTPAFNSVITRYMINAVIRGEVRTPEGLSGWLDNMIQVRPEYANFRPARH